MITGKNYIGKNLMAKGTISAKTINPKLNKENDYVCIEATSEEIDKAASLAEIAFKKFRKVSAIARAAFLNAIVDEILALDQELINTYVSESALPEARAIGERTRMIMQLKSFADLIVDEGWKGVTFDAAIPDRQPIPKEDMIKTVIPIGPIVVFGASNFPFAFSTAGGDTVSALAAGCPVIVKAHEMHAGTSELVASAIIKAAEKTGMPNGVFSHLFGRGPVVGASLVVHPKIKGVGFTGSFTAGKAIYDLATKREEPIPVFAEMGSVNPVVITPKAIETRGESIASTYAGSITLGTGQFCTNPGLILTIKGDQTEDFIQDLAQMTTAIQAQCMLHPSIKTGYDKNEQIVTSQKGVTTIAKFEGDLFSNYAAAAVACVSGEDFLVNPEVHKEVFGPFSLVVVSKNEEELIEIIEVLEGQLTGTIIADESEINDLNDIVDALVNRVGRIIFNGVPTGVEVCPSMHHGGPFPATLNPKYTSVGSDAIKRWVRPISYQSFPNELLPNELQNK